MKTLIAQNKLRIYLVITIAFALVGAFIYVRFYAQKNSDQIVIRKRIIKMPHQKINSSNLF